MPAADAVYQTSISINGKVDDSIFKGLRNIDTETGKIVKQEKMLGAESKKAFESMGKGLATATAKTKDFANSLKEMMLPLLGISIAFKGFTTVGDTIQAAIDKFKGAKEAAASFRATIESIVGRGRAGESEAFDVAQQERLKKQFEAIYGGRVFQDAQERMHKAGVALGDDALAGLIQTTAYLKKSIRITSTDVEEVAGKIARAITLPRAAPELRELLQTFGVQDFDKFTKKSGKERLQMILDAAKQVDFVKKQLLDPAMKDTKELMQAEVVGGGLMKQVGEFWEQLQIKGDLVTQHLKNAFLEVFVPASEQINKLLKGPMEDLDNAVKNLQGEFAKIFTPSKEDIDKGGYFKADTFSNIWQNALKAWREDFLPAIREDWKIFTDWAGAQFSNFERYARERISVAGGALSYEAHPMAARFLDFFDSVRDSAVNLGKIAGEIAKVSWETMQTAITDLANSAKQLAAAVTDFRNWFPTANAEAAARIKEELKKSGALPGGEMTPPTTHPGLHGFEHALGGIVNAPQVGLIGERGAESIVPLTRRDSNTLDILSGTFSALGIDPTNPTSYGHELFDSMRLGAGGMGPGGTGFSGNVGGIFYTEYGPSIDPPGSPDYDKNSYNRVGAWPGITGRLQPGDVALGYGAQARYGVSPGQTFTDTRGNTVRFADRSGSKNPMNEDVFRLAAGGVVSRKVLSWIGDEGREAVIPLEGNRGRRALQGALGGGAGGGHTFHFSPTINVSGVATSEVVDDLVDQLRSNFTRWLDDSAFEHQRTAFT